LILILVVNTHSAAAQTQTRAWPGLTTSAGSTIYVLDDTGRETSGTLLRLTAEGIDLLVNGSPSHFNAAHVRRLQARGDSLRNGALVGALVGLGLGAAAALISDCPAARPDGCPGSRAAVVAISTGAYAALGTGIDALNVGRTTLYEAPVGPSGTLSRATWPADRHLAIGFVIRW
jgi:hypothetical protein